MVDVVFVLGAWVGPRSAAGFGQAWPTSWLPLSASAFTSAE